MGNWRTVNIVGKIGKKECKEAINFLTVDFNYNSKASDELDIFYLQFSESLCGLGNWVKNDGTINAVGNLWERGCSIDALEDELIKLSNKFKTLEIKLHAGDDWEDLKCVATFNVKDGVVIKLPPEIDRLKEISNEEMAFNLLKQLMK